MIQLTIEDAIAANAPKCVVPDPETQCGVLLRAMQRGQRLTVAVALAEYGVYALSQRCTDLRRMGWPVQSRMISTPSGKRVAEYSLGEPEAA